MTTKAALNHRPGSWGGTFVAKSRLVRDNCPHSLPGEKCPDGKQLWPWDLGRGHLILLVSIFNAWVIFKTFLMSRIKVLVTVKLWRCIREKWKRLFAKEINLEVISNYWLIWSYSFVSLRLWEPVVVVTSIHTLVYLYWGNSMWLAFKGLMRHLTNIINHVWSKLALTSCNLCLKEPPSQSLIGINFRTAPKMSHQVYWMHIFWVAFLNLSFPWAQGRWPDNMDPVTC